MPTSNELDGMVNPFRTNVISQSVVCIEGSQVIIPKHIIFLSLKIQFGEANRADPDEMPRNAVYHVGNHCLTTYSVYKRLRIPQFSALLFKKLIQFLECSWNHKYFGSLAK